MVKGLKYIKGYSSSQNFKSLTQRNWKE